MAQTEPHIMIFEGRGGQLGVVIEDLDADGLKAAAGADSGVRIRGVDAESAAAKAGLHEGDIVVDVDGERVRSARQFSRLIQEAPAGRRVRLGIVRNGQRQTVEVVPDLRPFGFTMRDLEPRMRELEPRLREMEPRLREMEPRIREKLRDIEPRLREFRFDGPMNFDFDHSMTSARGRLGVQLAPLSPQLSEYFGARDGGVLVSTVTKDSAADKAGLKAGDVITSINGQSVRAYGDLIDQLRDVDSGDVTIGIVRDKKPSTLKATIEASAGRV